MSLNFRRRNVTRCSGLNRHGEGNELRMKRERERGRGVGVVRGITRILDGPKGSGAL